MGEDSHASEILRVAIDRKPVFSELRGGGATRSEIQSALEVSRSTTHRIVNQFESLGLVDQDNGAYELTSFGRVVADETERATTTVEVASHLSTLLGTFEAVDEGPNLEVFENATVTRPEPGDPYRPMRRLLRLVEDVSSVREFGPTAPEPAYQTAVYERAQSGLRAAILYPPPVVDQLRRNGVKKLEHALADGDYTLRVGDVPEFRLVIADEHVYVGGYNEDASRLELVVDTAEAGAVEWAANCFRRRWEGAKPYEQYVEQFE